MPLLDKLALEYNVNTRNQVKLQGQTVFLCLLNGLLNHPELSQRMLEEQYEKLTNSVCDHSSFGKRLSSLSPDFFTTILAHLRDKLEGSITRGDAKALNLRIVDATIVALSAKLFTFGIRANSWGKGATRQIKSVIELSDEGLPNILHICKDQSEHADVIALGETMKSNTKAGDIWIFDKGCHGREVMFSLHRAGSFWLTPHSTQDVDVLETLYQGDTALPGIPEVNEPALTIHRVERAVFTNKWKRIENLQSMELVLIHCYRWDMRQKCWKAFVLMTNLPISYDRTKAGPYSFFEITELYRRRWEIETFFKLLKQHLSYEHLTSRSENGIRIMILMSMITSLLMIWYRKQTDIKNGWKAVKFWLADDVRAWTVTSIRSMSLCRT